MRLKPIVQEKAKESYKENVGRPTLNKSNQNSDTIKIITNKELADVAGVSHNTIWQVGVIENEGIDGTIDICVLERIGLSFRHSKAIQADL